MAGKTKSEKTFDCIHYKRQVQSDIYEQIKGMTRAEELAYWKELGDALEAKCKAARQPARQEKASQAN